MLNVLTISETDRILIVAPHPDDECIGAGGLMSLFPKQCDVLVMTDGRQGQGNMSQEFIKEIRRNEFEREIDILKPNDCFYLEYEDGTMFKHIDALDDFELSKYTKIFVTGINDGHPDHSGTFLCIEHAFMKQKIENTKVYLYEVHNPLSQPSHILDITEVIDKKRDLIRCHNSQVSVLPYDEMSVSIAVYRALQNRMVGRYVEAFERVEFNKTSSADSMMLIELQKQRQFYWTLTRWLESEISGVKITEWLSRKGYREIVVYGYAEIGKLLVKEIADSKDMEIKYILDKKVICDDKFPVYRPLKGLEKPDCVVVTAIYYFDEIKEELKGIGFENIISIKDMVIKDDRTL